MSALVTTGTRVVPEWIDYNGHVMDGYYLVAFSDATEAILAALGFGAAYLAATGCTIYTVEAHVTYRREVAEDASLTFESRVVDHDEKRIHVFHVMLDADSGERLATAELMFIHVRQSTGKVEPFPAEQAARVTSMAAAQADLERPAELGRHLGIARSPKT